jgi:hypothetical protein
VVVAIALIPPATAESAGAGGAAGSLGAPAGAAANACCGAFGNAADWGGGSHFSLCIAGASCARADHAQVGVTYTSGPITCPSGYYDCVATGGPLACGYDCHGQDGCGSYSPSPSCCSGYVGGGCSNPEFRGCCGPTEIIMPTGIQKISSEWTVAYGNQVNNKPPPAKKR